MATTNPDLTLASLAEAAERCGCSARTIRRMVAGGHITAYRLPGVRSIRVDLDEIFDKLQVVPTAQA